MKTTQSQSVTSSSRRQFLKTSGLATLGGALASPLAFTQTGRVRPVWEFACEDQIGSSPETVLYVDDAPKNVQGASALGIRSLLFESVDRLRASFSGLVGGQQPC